MIRHTCDTTLCFNPHHLKEGSAFDNNADAWRRGRKVGNIHLRRTKLSREQVLGILAALGRGRTERSVAEECATTQKIINNVRRGRIYTSYSEVRGVDVHVDGLTVRLQIPAIVLSNLLDRYGSDRDH